MIDERLTLTIDETAELLGVSRSRIYRLIASQGLPTVKFGKKTLVARRHLEEWIDAQKVAS